MAEAGNSAADAQPRPDPQPDPNEKPFLSNAVETLPPRYSHPEKAELLRTLTENDRGPIDFAIQSH